MATEQELQIKINTLANTIGLDKAAAALEKMAVTAQSAGNTTAKVGKQVSQVGQQAAQAGESGAGGINVMSAATAAMNGNVVGAASALVPLIAKINALKAALTSVSIVIAALTLAYTVFSKISEYATKAAQAVADFNAKSRADMIDAVTRSYDRQAIAMDRISKLRDAELERTRAINDANKEFELASTKQAKLTELKGTTDETKRSEIEAKYARIEQQISGKYDSANESAEFENMKKAEEANWKKSELNARQILQKKAILRRTVNSAGEAEKAADDLGVQNAWGQNSGQIKVKEEEAKKAREAAEKLQEDIDKLEQDRINLADEAKRIKGLIPAAQVRMQASSLDRQNSRATLDIADSDRQRANQEALRPALQELDTEMADLNAADQKLVNDSMREANKELGLTVGEVKQMTDYIREMKTLFRDANSRERNR